MRNRYISTLLCVVALCISANLAQACSVCQATCPTMNCPGGYTPQVISDTCEQRVTTLQGVEFPDGCKPGGSVKCKCTNALGAHSGSAQSGSCNAVGIPCPPIPKEVQSVIDPVLCQTDSHK